MSESRDDRGCVDIAFLFHLGLDSIGAVTCQAWLGGLGPVHAHYPLSTIHRLPPYRTPMTRTVANYPRHIFSTPRSKASMNCSLARAAETTQQQTVPPWTTAVAEPGQCYAALVVAQTAQPQA